MVCLFPWNEKQQEKNNFLSLILMMSSKNLNDFIWSYSCQHSLLLFNSYSHIYPTSKTLPFFCSFSLSFCSFKQVSVSVTMSWPFLYLYTLYIVDLSFMCNLCTCHWCHINPSVKFTGTSAIYSLSSGKSPRFQTILANNQHHHQFTNMWRLNSILLNNQCVKEETKRKIKNITWCKLKWKHNIPKRMGYT